MRKLVLLVAFLSSSTVVRTTTDVRIEHQLSTPGISFGPTGKSEIVLLTDNGTLTVDNVVVAYGCTVEPPHQDGPFSFVGKVEARPAKPRSPGGDVHLTLSLRERIIVLAIYNGTAADSMGRVEALLSLRQAVNLDEAAAWMMKHPKANILVDAPDEQKPWALTQPEAEALVGMLAGVKPSKERPIDLGTGKLIVDVRDATKIAIDAALLARGAAKNVQTPIAAASQSPSTSRRSDNDR